MKTHGEPKMKITNVKKFNKTVKTLANFCKPKNKKDLSNIKIFHDVIFYSDRKLYASEGHIMGTIDISDCVSNTDVNDFAFPSNTVVNNSIELDIDRKLIIDGKQIDFKQLNWFFYKRILPTKKPISQMTFDFSEYKDLNVGYDKKKSPHVTFSKNEVIFDYKDESETICTIEDCFSTDILNDDFGDFMTVKFPMEQIFRIMKISKKFTIQQFQVDCKAMERIIAGDYEFLIMPRLE